MSQLYCSASSRYLIFSAIISVLICEAVAKYRFNPNNLLREQEMRDRTFENVKKELPKLLGLFVLKPSSIDRHKSEELNQKTPPPNGDIKINTSCGRKNCENVPNYPFKLIKNLLQKQTPEISQETILAPAYPEYEMIDQYENSDEMEESEEPEIAGAISNSFGRSYGLSSWLYPNEYPDENNLRRNHQECKLLAEMNEAKQNKKYKKMNQDNKNICQFRLKEIKPEETVDRKNQPFLLVRLKNSIIIKGFECIAGVDCIERGMSWNYKYHCETNWVYRDLCTLNNDKTAIVQKRVAIADGCNCTTVKIE